MSLFQSYSNEPISQLRQTVRQGVSSSEQAQLDNLLDLIVIKTIARQLQPAVRTQVLSMYRADATRLSAWLDEHHPALRMAITEALTRILLTFTVE